MGREERKSREARISVRRVKFDAKDPDFKAFYELFSVGGGAQRVDEGDDEKIAAVLDKLDAVSVETTERIPGTDVMIRELEEPVVIELLQSELDLVVRHLRALRLPNLTVRKRRDLIVLLENADKVEQEESGPRPVEAAG